LNAILVSAILRWRTAGVFSPVRVTHFWCPEDLALLSGISLIELKILKWETKSVTGKYPPGLNLPTSLLGNGRIRVYVIQFLRP
jgi:hypothetical protein